MLKVYGSDLCPDCIACKAALDAVGAEYKFINITESMRNLKTFLRLRDTDPVFIDPRTNGYVGIPALEEGDGSLTIDWESYCASHGIDPHPVSQKASCRIDGSGC